MNGALTTIFAIAAGLAALLFIVALVVGLWSTTTRSKSRRPAVKIDSRNNSRKGTGMPNVTCPVCSGAGGKEERCGTCLGRGCKICNQSGTIWKTCNRCNGHGTVKG